MESVRVVLLEKDDTYRSNLAQFLRVHGFDVISSATISELGDQNSDWAIYLLNFGSDTSWGLNFLSAEERPYQGPVLVLSDSDDHIDRVVCLELGADDYIVKTAHLREILARIRVAQRHGPSAPAVLASLRPVDQEVPASPWRFSARMRELTAPDGSRIDLTADQFNLLAILIQHAGRVLSRDHLSHALFDRPLKAHDRSIDNLVVRLRRKLGDSARTPDIVRTVRAGGYIFNGFPHPRETSRPALMDEPRRAA